MLNKITISGQITKAPEKRFTTNNFTITYFEINIGTQEDIKLIKCVATGKTAEEIAEKVKSLYIVALVGRLIFQEKEGKKLPMIDVNQYGIINANPESIKHSEIDYSCDYDEDLIGE